LLGQIDFHQSFSLDEIEQALAHLLPFLSLNQLQENERSMHYKLIAVLSYAKWAQHALYGNSD